MSSRQQQLTGPDRWQISYADLLTLLLGFFIVMYAVASMEADKKAEVITALQEKFSSTKAPESNGPVTPALTSGDIPLLIDTEFEVEAQGEWLYLEVASETVFASGSADLKTSAKQQLDALADWLATTEGVVEIEGHTDNQPINTAQYANNWALSSARAVAIVNYLTLNHAIQGTRFRAVGFGEYSPVADNSTVAGRQKNRRVVIKVENKPLYIAPVNAGNSVPKALASQTAAPQAATASIALSKNLEATTQKINTLAERLKTKGIDPARKANGGLKFTGGEE